MRDPASAIEASASMPVGCAANSHLFHSTRQQEGRMTSQPIRDSLKDHLLTPQNSALIVIDYQPVQVNSIASMDRQLLVNNIVGVAKTGKTYGLPIVLSTVNVKTGLNRETIHQLREVLIGVASYDRTTINSWEDTEFLAAVRLPGLSIRGA